MVMVIWVFWVCRNLANAKTPFSIHFILLHKLFAALQFLLLLLKYAWSAETSLFDGFFVCSLVHFRFFFKYLNSTRLFSFKIFMFENSFYCLLVFFFWNIKLQMEMFILITSSYTTFILNLGLQTITATFTNWLKIPKSNIYCVNFTLAPKVHCCSLWIPLNLMHWNFYGITLYLFFFLNILFELKHIQNHHSIFMLAKVVPIIHRANMTKRSILCCCCMQRVSLLLLLLLQCLYRTWLLCCHDVAGPVRPVHCIIL